MGIWTAIKRFLIYINFLAESAVENDAIDEAIVKQGIEKSKEKANRANYANGQLKGNIIMLQEQLKEQAMKKAELQRLLEYAISKNDEVNGASYAENLANIEADMTRNQGQLDKLNGQYDTNTEIIAQALREVENFRKAFEAQKVRSKVSEAQEALGTLIQSTASELQGVLGDEMGGAMQRMRERSAKREGQLQATLDLASKVGSGIKAEQEAKMMRGKMLFEQYKQKNAANVTVSAPTESTKEPEKQKQAITA